MLLTVYSLKTSHTGIVSTMRLPASVIHVDHSCLDERPRLGLAWTGLTVCMSAF